MRLRSSRRASVGHRLLSVASTSSIVLRKSSISRAQPGDPLALGRRIEDRHVLLQRVVDRAIRLLELAAIVVGGGRIGVEQRVADVHRSQQHLRADGREQFLCAHVPGVDRRGLALDFGDPLREVVADEHQSPNVNPNPRSRAALIVMPSIGAACHTRLTSASYRADAVSARHRQAAHDSVGKNTVSTGCRSIPAGRYRRHVSVTKPGPSIVVFSDVDARPARSAHAAVHHGRRRAQATRVDDTALVLCSGKTRAELEFVQQKLDITHPFICENGGAVLIPDGYFRFDVPNTRSLAGYQAVEFGRAYADVVDILHRTADRLRIEIVGFSDMSIEEVARECRLPLLQARLAKLREYEEPFRLRSELRGMVAAVQGAARREPSWQGRGRFDRVGAPVDSAVGVNLLNSLYRRGRGDVTTVGVTHTTPDDNLLRLVDHAIMLRRTMTGQRRHQRGRLGRGHRPPCQGAPRKTHGVQIASLSW